MESRDDRAALQAIYINHLMIGHSRDQFLFDFGQRYEETDGTFHTRLITYPVFARAMLALLTQSIASYEREHGAIDREGVE